MSSQLNDWLREHLDPAPAGGLVAAGRALQLRLAGSDPERFDRLRYAILWRALVREFHQPEDEVTALLRQEVLGDFGAAARVDDPVAWEGLPIETVPLEVDARSLPELVVLAIEELDGDEHWGALAAEPRSHPMGWLARRLTWRLRDRLRRRERRVERAEPAVRKHHRIAGWLEIVALADPEHGGPIVALRGLHRSVLSRIRARLDEAPGTLGPSFALRKLFPPQAWPPEDPSEVGALGRWLLGRLDDHWADRADWATAARALGERWGTPPTVAVRESLDVAADHHLRADSFPSLPEVACWCGDDPWLGRKISRVDLALEPLVKAALERVRSAAEELCT